MLIGKTYEDKRTKRYLKRQKEYDAMVPHRVFAWLPRRLFDGRYVWFQDVYRIRSNFEENSPKNDYFITRKEAIDESVRLNYNTSYHKKAVELLSRLL